MTDRNDRPFDFLHASLVEKCEAIAKLTPDQREILTISALVEIVEELMQIEEVIDSIPRDTSIEKGLKQIEEAIDAIRLNV